MPMYRVVMQRIRTDEKGWTCSEQVPTFHVDAHSIVEARAKIPAITIAHDRHDSTRISGGIVDDATEEYLGFTIGE